MKKVTLVLLLVVCVSSITFAEVGKYQLVSGKFSIKTKDLQKGGSEQFFHEGLFRINTETGLVEEYELNFITDKEGNQIVEADWDALITGKATTDKDILK